MPFPLSKFETHEDYTTLNFWEAVTKLMSRNIASYMFQRTFFMVS